VLSCDLLLSLFDADLYQPVVTPTILAEVERSLLTGFAHLDPNRVRRRVEQMAEALGLNGHLDADAGAEALVGVNAKDRHVAAIAGAAHADLIVTNDRRLRHEITTLRSAVRAVGNDEFALLLFSANPELVSEVIDTLVSKRTRRPVARDELLAQLAPSFPRPVAEVHARR
jgi:hypothetical protein